RGSGVGRRPARPAEIELAIEPLLLKKRQQQCAPGETAWTVVVSIAEADTERRAVRGWISGDIGRRENLVRRLVIQQREADLLQPIRTAYSAGRFAGLLDSRQ